MRMRTIEQCVEHVKQIDPETALTKTAIRRLVVTGQLSSVRVGNKYLVALEILEDFLRGASEVKPAPENVIRYGTIRQVEV